MAIGEKRLYPRVSLSFEDGYFAHFKLPNQEVLVASIVNLSAGGINAAVPESDQNKVQEGDSLLLQHIIGGRSLAFLSGIKAEIRWIKQLDRAGYVSMGCKFRELAEPVRQQLNQFVHSERMTRGQYD